MLGRGSRLTIAVAVAVASFPSLVRAAETVIPIAGDVPDDGLDHFRVPFEVPEGTVEIEVRHDDLSMSNILDWGLEDPSGRRGWGGGNSEPAIVGLDAASRSYSPGPIPAGTWNVIVGKAQILDPPGQFELEIVLRDAASATLAPQPERQPYVPSPALVDEPGWYAGDVHVHSLESGDARPPLDEIGDFATSVGLHWVVISDHNVHTALDFLGDVQPRHPGLLFVPGVEFTTYAGHANGIGATSFVSHELGQPGVTIEGAVQAYHDQGALFVLNHPTLELGALCIGCAWDLALDPAMIDAVEIATGGLEPFAGQYTESAIEQWDELCAQGLHVVPLGGSDDHRAGVDLSPFQSPIGSAATVVLADRLDAAGIVEGIRRGRTVVKLQGPDDPMVELAALQEIDGDTIRADEVTLTAVITGAAGQQVRLVENGASAGTQAIDEDPAMVQWNVTAPAQGQDRYRVEILVDGERRVVTSHLWVEAGPASSDTGDMDTGLDESGGTTSGGGADSSGSGTSSTGSAGASEGADDGCGCTTTDSGGRAWAWMLLMVLGARRRHRPGPLLRSSP
ncbi:CehA/McbA family metallohydrolase [Paraliomyxa miuraensis]|uniref:CehA/McbA family metallohydrolase n=1 Tax=Paraliomyxa miuraensis TaxID=376150 RepID=UPI00225411AF|nr:CehA/McbA family metallohydrolase [Paraliomyxa miuraensis]MCX4244022.1 CehA/McbA family metallohydrolase [Paraliomyxa miuraensis]